MPAGVISVTRDRNRIPGLVGTSNSDGTTPVAIFADPATQRLLVDAGTITIGALSGNKSNNTAAPGSTNLGVLPAIANAAAPTYSEGNQVLLSTDLTGAVRVTGSLTTSGTTDNSAFTAGTSTGTPAFGFYHSTIDSVTDGRSASLAIDSKRNLFTVIRDAAGNARGANVDTNNNMGVVLAAETTKVIGTINIAAAQTIATVTAVTAITNALPAGANLLGKVGIDQTTPGTTNAVFATNFPTTVDTNSGNKSASTIRIVLATDQPNFTTPLNVALAANQSVNVAQFGGTNVVNGGTAGIQSVGGSTATNVALTENPLNMGAQAVSSENSAVTTARKVQLVADLVGKLITLPYANPENFVSGATAAITDTTNTSVIASAGGSLRNYVTHILVTNSHATVSTLVEIRDGATTVLYRGYALAAGGGFSVTLPVPLRGTAATAVTASCITTGSNVYVSASGYKGV